MMRNLLLTAGAAFTLSLTALPASADVVNTFKSVCLANLDNIAGIQKAAQSAGFKVSPLSEIMGKGAYIADRKKTDESVQVNVATTNKFECAVTTSDVSDPEKLRQAFFASLGIKTDKTTVTAKVNGKQYTFKFDTNGGEALVVYR